LSAQLSNPFEALADPHRRAILELLHDGARSVREIYGTRRLYRLHDEGLDAVRVYLTEVWGNAAARFRLVADNSDPA
jgi:hypothetical protein